MLSKDAILHDRACLGVAIVANYSGMPNAGLIPIAAFECCECFRCLILLQALDPTPLAKYARLLQMGPGLWIVASSSFKVRNPR